MPEERERRYAAADAQEPDAVAAAIVHAVSTPPGVTIRNIILTPTRQEN